jgi:hypothetical protein
MTEMQLANVDRKKKGCWYLLVLSWIKCYIIPNECLFICVDFRCVVYHMQIWLGKKMAISHFGYWHFLSTANSVCVRGVCKGGKHSRKLKLSRWYHICLNFKISNHTQICCCQEKSTESEAFLSQFWLFGQSI